MAELIRDRVKETSTTTGTGSITLAGAVTGYRTWSGAGFANNDTGYYCIEHQSSNEWEVGLGTWTTGGVLVRTTPLAGSSATPVNFSAGTKHVFNSVPAAAYQTISDLTEDTAPDGEADFLAMFDTSAGASEKLKPRNMFKNSSFHLGGKSSPAALSSNQNDWNPTGLANAAVIRVDASATVKITGLAGGEDGRFIIITNISTVTDGDVILTFEDSSSAAANRFAGDNDIILEAGSGAALLWYDSTISRWRVVSVRRKFTGTAFRHSPFYATDFLGAATADTGESSYAVWDYAVISSGTQSKIASEATHPGILRTTSSTTTNSGGYCRTDATAILLGGGEVAEFVFRIIDLTTLTFRLGFIDTATSADCVDGAYIEVPSTGNAVGKTSNNSTRTTSATIAALSTNTWYRARIVVNRAATAVDFYIYNDAGDQLGTVQVTTNIPTAAGRQTGHGYIATKSGTTAQACVEMDYMSLEFTKALI